MKILRSVTRRGFSVGTAGWFTVLRPNTWFPASRLTGRVRGDGGRPDVAGGGPQAAAALNFLPFNTRRRVMPMVLIGLAATAIAAAGLWWIMHP